MPSKEFNQQLDIRFWEPLVINQNISVGRLRILPLLKCTEKHHQRRREIKLEKKYCFYTPFVSFSLKPPSPPQSVIRFGFPLTFSKLGPAPHFRRKTVWALCSVREDFPHFVFPIYFPHIFLHFLNIVLPIDSKLGLVPHVAEKSVGAQIWKTFPRLSYCIIGSGYLNWGFAPQNNKIPPSFKESDMARLNT